MSTHICLLVFSPLAERHEHTVRSFPTLPWENNHYGHFGNPPLESFSCNISGEASSDESLENEMSPSCELIDLITDNVKGAIPASPRLLASDYDDGDTRLIKTLDCSKSLLR